MYSLTLGIACALLGNTIISASFTLLKRAHNENVPYTKSKQWWAGMVLMGPGECLNLVAFAFAPVTLVSPLGSSGIVTTALFAAWFLGEKFQKKGYAGIAAVAGGGTLISMSMPPHEVADTLSLLHQNISGAFSLYVAVTVSFMIAFAFSSSLSSVVYMLGVCGMICSLSCRAVASLVSEHPTHPLFFAAAFYAVFSIVLQCIQFQKALESFSLTQVVPMHYAGVWVYRVASTNADTVAVMQLLVAVGGGLLFEDINNAKVDLFVIGLLLCIVGAFVTAKARVIVN